MSKERRQGGKGGREGEEKVERGEVRQKEKEGAGGQRRKDKPKWRK